MDGEHEVEVREKLAQVQEWLEDIFAGEEIPEYEINSQSIGMLYDMATSSQREDDVAKIAIEDMEQKTKEYLAETNRLGSEGKWLGLSKTDLSPMAAGHLETLAATALSLDLGDCSDTSLCLSLNELCQHRAKDEVARAELQKERDSVQDSLRLSLLKQANQKRVLGKVAKELRNEQSLAMAKQISEAQFLKQKAHQYQKLVSTMKEELTGSGYQPSISHGSLQELAKEVEDLQSQLVPLKSELSSYRELPPDFDLAKVKVHETRCCLARLEDEYSKSVDL